MQIEQSGDDAFDFGDHLSVKKESVLTRRLFERDVRLIESAAAGERKTRIDIRPVETQRSRAVDPFHLSVH